MSRIEGYKAARINGKTEMTSRERVRAALGRRESDRVRVPIDFGGRQPGITHEACGPLEALMGVKSALRLEERVQGLGRVDESV